MLNPVDRDSVSTPSVVQEKYRKSPHSLEELERAEIKAALTRNGWVQARAARELGLTQRQIGYRMKKFNLERPEWNRINQFEPR
jgi:Nif-specific regulatory protein